MFMNKEQHFSAFFLKVVSVLFLAGITNTANVYAEYSVSSDVTITNKDGSKSTSHYDTSSSAVAETSGKPKAQNNAAGTSGTASSSAGSTNTAGSNNSYKVSGSSGVYEGRRVIPEVMADYCNITAEEVVNDTANTVLRDCMAKYVMAMNNENAAERSKAIEDFVMLKYNVLSNLLATATTKNQSVDNYEGKMNQYNDAYSRTETVHESEAGITNTTAFMTDVMNSNRELLAAHLFYEAINGIADIDPRLIADECSSAICKNDNPNIKRTKQGSTEVEYQGTKVESSATGYSVE